MSDVAKKLTYLPDVHRLLPQNVDAEMAILSALVLAPHPVFLLCQQRGVREIHFHIPAYLETYKLLCAVIASGGAVDFVTITNALRDANRLDAVGGPAFISSLFTFLATATNAAHYLDILEEKAILRETIRICTEYAARSYDEQDDPLALASGAQGELSKLINRRAQTLTVRQAIVDVRDEIVRGSPDGTILPTGWKTLDNRLTLYLGDVLYITAPTSCGKSALAMQLAVSVADTGKRAAVYPLEMTTKALVKRALSNLGGVNVEWVRKCVHEIPDGPRTAGYVSDFTNAAIRLQKLPLHVRDDLYTFDAILADMHMRHAESPFSFVVIDYLQLLRTGQKFERKQLEIAYITQRLKQVAKDMNVVICIPSQVNKDGGTREAQDAENDASALLKIIAKQNSAGDNEFDRLQIWKQREGQRFVDVPCRFNGSLTRFEDI